MSECQHIYGYENDYDTGISIIDFEGHHFFQDDEVFTFCPRCGERLVEDEEARDGDDA